jgi:hypothetical protein
MILCLRKEFTPRDSFPRNPAIRQIECWKDITNTSPKEDSQLFPTLRDQYQMTIRLSRNFQGANLV